MGALDPKFRESFLLAKEKEKDPERYGTFIQRVRNQVAKSCTHPFANVPYVLPPEVPKKIPELWFHIEFRKTNSGEPDLTLAVRMDNLYLVGFRTSAGPFPGVWWEFNNDEKTHLIISKDRTTKVNWLGFSGSYKDLVGDRGLETIDLGRDQMGYAVEELAKYKPPRTTEMILEGEEEEDPYGAPKMMLASLVIMLCEGLRFVTVSSTVDNMFYEDPKITETEATHVRYWVKISKAMLTNDFSDVEEETGIKDREGASKIVALVKYQKTSTGENKDEL